MSATDALNELKRGNAVDYVTPDGKPFQIQSKLSHGLSWYRVRPTTRGCLNNYSRLTDSDMLQWLESVAPRTVERVRE
jgi:hypothetical protein